MRQDHVRSAVVFLQEPQVASASLAKKVEFLESKGLTTEEINEALKQADGSSDSSSSSAASSSSSENGSVNSTTPRYPVDTPPRPNYMMQQPPPIPKRDWKDYFVMATVSAGVVYGIYECTKRYVWPMIMPPTPPALEADKQALEEEFQRTEQLLKQLQEDTDDLKKQEDVRNETFNSVMEEARIVIKQFKQHVDDHQSTSKLALSNVETLRDTIPRSLQQHSDAQAQVVEQLKDEIQSLKILVNRRGVTGGAPAIPPASSVPSTLPGFNRKKPVEEKPKDEPAKEATPKEASPKEAAPKETTPKETTSKASSGDTEKSTDSTDEKNGGLFVPDPQSRIPEWQRVAAQQN